MRNEKHTYFTKNFTKNFFSTFTRLFLHKNHKYRSGFRMQLGNSEDR